MHSFPLSTLRYYYMQMPELEL